MKNNNLIKILIIIIVILSMGLVTISAKLLSIEKYIKIQDSTIVTDDVAEKIKEEVILDPPRNDSPVENNPLPEVIEKNEPSRPDKVIISPKYISKDEAISIGLKKVGNQSILVEIESDLDDNPPKYELEIILGAYEYELEIHAITGAIIDFERDEID